MKNSSSLTRVFAIPVAVLLTVVAVILGFLALPAYAAPTSAPASCVGHRSIENFNSASQLGAQGFFFQMFSSGTYGFNDHVLSLDLGTTATADYAASRISEIDTVNLPPEYWTKCWQPTNSKDVVVEYTIRFDQAATPGLTENAMLWNAGLATGAPLTAFGVTRTPSFGGAYFAIVVQDFNYSSGLISMEPIFVDPTQWHTIRVTLSQTNAKIEIAQNGPFSVVLDQALLYAPAPTGFEFSVDNEAFPGYYVPVQVPDGMDVSSFEVQLSH